MTIKQHGGVFGRNPKFNSIEAESLSIAGNAVPDASTILVDGDIGSTVQGYDADTAKLDVAQTFTAAQTFNENIVMANTKGIDFSATAGTGTSELFDDYEEGTFTPVWQNLTLGNGTTSGSYIKVGRMVFVNVILTWGSTTSASGNVSVSGSLPFTSDATTNYGSGNALDSGTTNYILRSQVTPNSTNMSFQVGNAAGSYLSSGGSPTATVPMTWTTNDVLSGSCFYMAAS